MARHRAVASTVGVCLFVSGAMAACGGSGDSASSPGGTGAAAGTSSTGGHAGSSGSAGSKAGAGGASGSTSTGGHSGAGAGGASGAGGHAGSAGSAGTGGSGGSSAGGAAGHAGASGASAGTGGSAGTTTAAGGHGGGTSGGGGTTTGGSGGASCGSAVCCPGDTRECGTCNLGTQACDNANWGTCVYSTPAPTLSLGGTLRDFKSFSAGGDIDFDNETGDDKGIVKTTLGSDMKPVYGYPDDGTGSPTTHGKMSFDQWYRDVPGINQTEAYTLVMQLVPGSVPPQYTFTNNDFFPLDGMLWGNEGYDHNFSFTLELHTQFLYAGGEQFSFTGDDDLYVFINGQLAINLGGVHGAETGVADLDALAGALGISTCNQYSFDLFFAERHRTQSEFAAQTTIVLTGKE